MSEKELLKILDIFMKYVRLDDEESAKDEFKKILLANPKVTKNITDKIYDVGEIFRYIEPHQYIVVINAFLNKQESYILRLL